MLTRRRLLAGAAALAAAGAAGTLAGCGSGAKGSGGGSGSGALRFSWWGGDERAAATQKVIGSFTSSHPGTTVTPQFADWGSYWQKTATTAAGGNLPDVLQMDVTHVQQFVSNNQLSELDTDKLGLADTDQALLTPGTVGGKLYAVGTGGNMSTLMYNQTALKEVGAEVPADGLSWDGLASFARELQPKLGLGKWVIDAGYASIWYEIFLRQRYQELWTDDGKITYTKADVLDWFTYWHDLQEAGVVVPPGKAPNAASGEVSDSPFALGFTVLGPEWSNLFPTAADLVKDEVAITRTPTGGSMAGDSINPTMQWSISAKAGDPELASTFVSYLLHDPASVETIGLDRGVPGNPEARKLVSAQLGANDKQTVTFLEKFGGMGRPVAVLLPAHAGEITDALVQAGDSLSLGKATPSQAADVYWDQAQQISQS